MNSSAGAGEDKSLADRFALLWENGGASPDILAFLGGHPGATVRERMEVLEVDRCQRRGRGLPLPTEHYKTVVPEFASRLDWIEGYDEGTEGLGDAARGLLETLPSEDTFGGQGEAVESGRTSRVRARLLIPGGDGSETLPLETRVADVLTTDGGFALYEGIEDDSRYDSVEILKAASRFTIQRTLGAGGMGVVYQAFDRERGETVALKTMRRADPRALFRFKDEFRILSDLSHPNLVNLYELFALGDLWFFTMELVEGTDFITYIRSAPGGPDAGGSPLDVRNPCPDRLRAALRPLVEGVIALHDAGRLHRDIKPRNVLVTGSGRVVLLDFGLVTEFGRARRRRGTEEQIVGTVAYMAPEQGAALEVSTAADWYSVGVVLYEAMTGRLPFRGRVLEVLAAKQERDPPPPGTLVEGVAPDLDALCVALLRRDPKARPSGPEILERLDGVETAPHVAGFLTPGSTPAPARAVPLIGRERHREVLRDAFEGVKAGRPEAVFVSGRTGTGKSALLESFLDELVEQDEAVVLSGRCHERESMPYKSLDCVVDALGRYLIQVGASAARPLLPRDVWLLARVFPVLQRVEAVAEAPRPAFEPPDQQELRRRAFAALRELLARIGDLRPLVVAIDDLQWGDLEDAAPIVDLLRPPGGPVLLFVGSFRSEDSETSPILQALLHPPGMADPALGRRKLAVESLSQSEARTLALAMLGHHHPAAGAEAHLIARESRGNPLFIGELVRHVQAGGRLAQRLPCAGQVALDEVLWARIGRLAPDARRLLEAVAVSGRPIGQIDVARACGLGADARASAVAVLRAARLIRATGQAHRDQIAVYHDRIREIVLAHLAPEVVAEHHRGLAATLEASGVADPEALAAHFRGAGEREKAGRYAAMAADQAAEGLAFAHAARLYRQALAARGEGDANDAESRRLRTGLGDALANAGKGGEAARAYLDAAEGTPVSDAFELRRRAATQLLISGHVDEGLQALRTVLAAVGMAVPSGPRHALAWLLARRAWLRLRGLGFRGRDESDVASEVLARIDVCWSAVAGLSIIDPILGAGFQARGLILALRAGEPYRIARALALEAAHVSTGGVRGRRRFEQLQEVARPLAESVGHPHARALVRLVDAIAALMFGHWAEARDAFDRAEGLFRERCTGVAWELDTIANLSLWGIARLGDINELRKRWQSHMKEARRRGDLYAITTLNTFYMTVLRLADDDPEGARRELAAVMADWTPLGFHIQHANAFRARLLILLYRGEWHAAWEHVRATWPSCERSMLLRIQMLRIELREARARCALAAAMVAQDPIPLWRVAEQDARRLERERIPWAEAHARLIRAGLASARGQSAKALALLADATRRFDALGMRLEAAVARRRLGERLGGTQGSDLVREADEWLVEQGVRAPQRFCEVYAPGLSAAREGGPLLGTASTDP